MNESTTARSKHPGGEILSNSCHTANKGMSSNMTELMDSGKTANDGKVINCYMSSQGGSIGQYDMTSYMAVMSYMRIGHAQIVASYACDTSTAFGSSVECGKFANGIFISKLKPGDFTPEFEILRSTTNESMGMNVIALTYAGILLDDRMCIYTGTVTDIDVIFNNGIRAYFHTSTEFCTRSNNSRGMDHRASTHAISSRLVTAAVSSASAASCPST